LALSHLPVVEPRELKRYAMSSTSAVQYPFSRRCFSEKRRKMATTSNGIAQPRIRRPRLFSHRRPSAPELSHHWTDASAKTSRPVHLISISPI
jgi:hypothetical protein